MIFLHLWCFISGNFNVIPVMTRNMVDLKDEILSKIDEKFNDFKIAIIAEISDPIKQGGLKKREIQLNLCNIFFISYLMNSSYSSNDS